MTNEVYNEIVQVSKAKKYLFTNAAIQTCFSTYGTISSDSNLLDFNTCIVSINSPALTLSDYRYLSDVFIFANIGSIQNVLLDGSTRQTTAQILGLSTTLTTSTKTSLIAAINEVHDTAFRTAGSGLTSSGTTVSLASTTAGDGLTYTTGVLNVVAGDTSLTVGADSIAVNLKTSSGLQISSGLGISLATTSGLSLTSGLAVGAADTSITVSTNAIGVNLKSSPGLQISSGLGVLLDTNSGLQLTSGLALTSTVAGNGLTLTSGALNVVAGDTSLTVGADSIAVNLKTSSGLQISSGLGVLLATTSGLSLTSGLAVGATDASIAVAANAIKVNIGTIDNDGPGVGTTTHPAGLEVIAAANSGTAGLGVKVDGTTITINPSGNLVATTAPQVRNAADTGSVTIDIALVGANPTASGEGLSNLNSYISVRNNIVTATNSLFTQKLPFLLQACNDNAANMIIFLKKLVSPTTTDSALGNRMECSQLVARISNGISSGTKTVFCTPFPTACSNKAACETSFNNAITGITGNAADILANTELAGVLKQEVCSQYDI